MPGAGASLGPPPGAGLDLLMILGALLALVGLLLVAALALPVAIEFQVEHRHGTRGRATLRGLFGLVRVRIDRTAAASPAPPPPGREPQPAGRARGRRDGGARVRRLLGDAAWRRRVLRLARDLLRVVQLRHLSLRGRLGLGDPADTGLLWAVLGPLEATVRPLTRIELRLQPDFVEAVCEVDAQGECVLVPLHVVRLGLGFVLAPATWRAWRDARPADA